MAKCPCASGKQYINCCERFITGKELPGTPEELMRSRYTAYTQANIDYIQKTMRAPANKNYDPIASKKWAKNVTWVGLKVLKSSMQADHGYVEFMAEYIEGQQKHIIHELSEFLLENCQWFYIDGVLQDR